MSTALGQLGLSTDYKGLVAFGILTAMLIVKPSGLAGFKLPGKIMNWRRDQD